MGHEIMLDHKNVLTAVPVEGGRGGGIWIILAEDRRRQGSCPFILSL